MNRLRAKCNRYVALFIAFLFAFPCTSVAGQRNIPLVEDVIKGLTNLPTIEDLTGGKVKKGDVIDRDNVHLVRDFLSPAVYSCVLRGMVLRMGKQLPPHLMVNRYVREATKRNKGKAIMDANGTVWYERPGIPWPGGIPFPEPRNGLQAAANVKYGCVYDDLLNTIAMSLVNPEGKVYKTVNMEHRIMLYSTRTVVPPLGSIPGDENIMWKRISVITAPLELKGLGQYTIRYYDDARYHDTGFVYLPAFKRTIRVSATTWQDNVAGSDMTYGDGQGLSEPFSDWSFKLIDKRYLLLTEPESPIPFLDENVSINKRLRFDVGRKFPRNGWAIWPVHVVEGTPKKKHIYGKKIFYTHAWPYWNSVVPFAETDIYDRQLRLWKLYLSQTGNHYYVNRQPYATEWGTLMYDMQADHMTQYWYTQQLNKMNYRPADLTLKTLLQIGR
ncbi:MAG: DUF1329 domain-containing protein [Thermodesulfobacteriota bacterium]|nr:DUF1329 domain-containing protein [Thermodesulfobacteriota bacterium]